LLFRGYGRSNLTASIYAGLAAHDSLILLDEAHLSMPFLETLSAIVRFRGPDWAESPIATPFTFSFLSATPPDMRHDEVFPSREERDRAVDHPVLRDRMSASKPAEMVTVKSSAKEKDSLVLAAVARAQSYVEEQGKRRVAVVVNRVRTAHDIWENLRTQADAKADIVLLTGRIRPYERDRLVEKWKKFLRANSPEQPEKPIILVSTQCIEVGADFSFDALVTEAASLDALRQRFGRLNRWALPGRHLQPFSCATTTPKRGSPIQSTVRRSLNAGACSFRGKTTLARAARNKRKMPRKRPQTASTSESMNLTNS
jgi:CRISPR-associated endonuclease/helicase Cas3